MTTLSSQVQQCLETNILPYWINKVQDPDGGFYGRVDGHDNVHPEAERGAVLNARILWAFSAAYRVLHKPEYLAAAENAYRYVTRHFIDPDFGGVYWSVDCHGKALDPKKQTMPSASPSMASPSMPALRAPKRVSRRLPSSFVTSRRMPTTKNIMVISKH